MLGFRTRTKISRAVRRQGCRVLGHDVSEIAYFATWCRRCFAPAYITRRSS